MQRHQQDMFKRCNSDKRRQPDLNLREPSPGSVAARPRLKLLPCTIKDPVNTVVHTERNASIFGTGKPSESSLVNETKRTLSQSNKDSGQSADWRKTLAANDSQYNINMRKPSFRYDSCLSNH